MSKKQHRQALRLSVVFVGLAISLGLAFIFVVLPNFGRISVLLGRADAGLPVFEDTVPPQRPIVAGTPSATNTASLRIQGFTEPGSTAYLVWDGVEAKQVGVDDSGEFSFSLLLKDGPNELVVFAEDAAENQSPTSEPVVVVFDNEPPSLEIEAPEDGASFTGTNNQRMTFTGTTEAGTRVFLNGRLVAVKSDGVFESTVFLSEGETTYTIEARDQAGNTTTEERTVRFSR